MNEKVWNIGRLIMTGKNRSIRRKTCTSATLPTINPARGGLGLEMRLRVIGQRLNAWAMARSYHNIKTSEYSQ